MKSHKTRVLLITNSFSIWNNYAGWNTSYPIINPLSIGSYFGIFHVFYINQKSIHHFMGFKMVEGRAVCKYCAAPCELPFPDAQGDAYEKCLYDWIKDCCLDQPNETIYVDIVRDRCAEFHNYLKSFFENRGAVVRFIDLF